MGALDWMKLKTFFGVDTVPPNVDGMLSSYIDWIKNNLLMVISFFTQSKYNNEKRSVSGNSNLAIKAENI